MHEAGFPTLYSLFGTYAGQARDLESWTRNGQLNTDANLRLQYLAGLSFNNYQAGTIFDEVRGHLKFPENVFGGSQPVDHLLQKPFTSRTLLAALDGLFTS